MAFLPVMVTPAGTCLVRMNRMNMFLCLLRCLLQQPGSLALAATCAFFWTMFLLGTQCLAIDPFICKDRGH